MHYTDTFLELEYGKLYSLDLHGKTLEEARASLIHILSHKWIFCMKSDYFIAKSFYSSKLAWTVT